jgi:hypothetical protein
MTTPVDRQIETWTHELREIDARLQITRIDVSELEKRRVHLRKIIADAHDMKVPAATAWLIERTDVQLCYSRGWTSTGHWCVFTNEDAWRFASKSDAEDVIRADGLTGVVATEHEWVSAPRKPT